MTAPDIRFDCKFCNKPVKVPAKYAGQRVKCPSCKNPVVVPAVEGALAVSFEEAKSSPGQVRRVSEKPVRGGGVSFAPLVKLALLAAVAAGGWFGWQWWQGQKSKPLPMLFEEYAGGTLGNELVIKSRCKATATKPVSSGDLTTLQRFAKHQEPNVRQLAVECLGLAATPAALTPLLAVLDKDADKNVRREAGIALGSIRQKKVVAALVAAMQKERDAHVVGGIRQGLVELTGQTGLKANPIEWKNWWSVSEKTFTVSETKP